MEQYWHTCCLKCSCCHTQLGKYSSTCYSKGGMILFKEDYISKSNIQRKTQNVHLFVPLHRTGCGVLDQCQNPWIEMFVHSGACSACGESIPASEMVMRAQGRAYHLKCFTCTTLRNGLVPGDRFHYINGTIFCEHDRPGGGLHTRHPTPLQVNSMMSNQKQVSLTLGLRSLDL
ncbi:LIM domain transcription factor LMO4.1-like [Xiphias gladius]|uniref:LIM domain transcription factor LMO4.1-like n=1 Tax=Xiphias gladius TaxID=8245 RepID=UPI001A9822B7|nr:LIM domain transcription factor LMO4.1-like [Xiphias gladius]